MGMFTVLIRHIVLVHGGEQCTCGRKGCWERYASANALIRQTMAAMDQSRDSIMWGMVGGDLSRVDGRTAFEAMRKGDAAARAVVDQYLRYLADGLSNFVNIFQPEVIALGGGVSHERDEAFPGLPRDMSSFRPLPFSSANRCDTDTYSASSWAGDIFPYSIVILLLFSRSAGMY